MPVYAQRISKLFHGRRKESPKQTPSAQSQRSSASTKNTSVRSSLDSTQDCFVHGLVAKAAEDKKVIFHNSLPPSLTQPSSEAQSEKNDVASFEPEEIVLGPLLGTGEFSNVYEIQSFHLQIGGAWREGEPEKRLEMIKKEKYRQTDKSRYAIKHIKEDYLQRNGSDAYIEAACDLVFEAEFLANLSHPNIIKLRGLARSGADGFERGPCGYFLVIDRLFETLDQWIKRWHGSTKDTPFTKGGMLTRGGAISPSPAFKRSSIKEDGIEVDLGDRVMDGCLSVGLQISAAMMYLHLHSIIFRDLKPANVGFDVRGDVKVFDFGLARVVPEGGDTYKDTFEMSGAGSPRYMAPELMSGEEYNLKADVYTFAILLWEILSGDTPYAFVRSRDQLYEHVVEEHGRPEIEEIWPDIIKGTLESSFDVDAEKRPKMEQVYNAIKKCLLSLGGDKSCLTDAYINRRRSVRSVRSFVSGRGSRRSSLLSSKCSGRNCSGGSHNFSFGSFPSMRMAQSGVSGRF